MKLLSKIIVGTSCVTIFCGSAYFATITLAPPPNYTVSNSDRLKNYDKLSVNNLYEKKTKSQEFYLGLSRWRRKMLREEGLLQGRVLEVGAGCGGNIPYYPKDFFTDNTEIQKHLPEVVDNVEAETPSNGSGESSTSFLLQHIDKDCPCDEIILCDRSAGMVHSCMLKVESRLGYVPYRYPNYDVEGIRSEIESGLNCAKGNAANATAVMAVRKRKVLHGDGTIQEVLVTPLEGNELDEFLTAVSSRDGTPSEVIVPIIQGVRMGEKLELLSKSGKAEVAARAELVQMREQFRNQVQDRLRRKERQILQKRDDSGSSFSEGDWTARRGALAPPQELMDEGKTLQRQPLFSVANYAAEQLPFADNSFDTIVDTFGLCSYDDPVRALRELSRVCKPSGRILLIEHGKGTAQRVNSHLDKWAPRHAKNWGCWWNRDIRRAVRLSGLSVEKWEDKHFGTSHYIIAKPYKTMQEWEAYEQMQATKRV